MRWKRVEQKIMTANLPRKPLGIKSYGSIAHLPGSRISVGDHKCHEGQKRIATEKTRDRHDSAPCVMGPAQNCAGCLQPIRGNRFPVGWRAGENMDCRSRIFLSGSSCLVCEGISERFALGN